MAKSELRILARPVALVCAGLSVGVCLGWAQPARVIEPLDVSKTIVLTGNRTLEAHPKNDQGPVDIFLRISGITLGFRSHLKANAPTCMSF